MSAVVFYYSKGGITVSDNYFSCYGHFLFIHKNRPNEEDLQKAEKFAKENF